MPSDKEENERSEVNLELVLNMLAEASTTDLSQKKKPRTFSANKKVAAEGGSVAAAARKQLEAQGGSRVVTRLNAKSLKALKQVEDK